MRNVLKLQHEGFWLDKKIFLNSRIKCRKLNYCPLFGLRADSRFPSHVSLDNRARIILKNRHVRSLGQWSRIAAHSPPGMNDPSSFDHWDPAPGSFLIVLCMQEGLALLCTYSEPEIRTLRGNTVCPKAHSKGKGQNLNGRCSEYISWLTDERQKPHIQ